MNKLNILILILVFAYSCTSVSEDNTITDEIIEVDNYIIEGTFIKKINDSLNLYNCQIYDTLNDRLEISGEHIIYSDDFAQPIGWLKYWDDKGKLQEKIDYRAYNNSKESEINQIIKFGSDTLDTIYNESNFLKHKLALWNNDSIIVTLRYRGWKENESNFAFTLYSDTIEKFIFRNSIPSVSFKIPIEPFLQDSTIRVFMIKSYDYDVSKDMLTIESMNYYIELDEIITVANK